MMSAGFGLLRPDESDAPTVADRPHIAAQFDAAIKLVVALRDVPGADGMGSGLSALEPMKQKGIAERLAFAVTARWMGDAAESNEVLAQVSGDHPDDALVRAVIACRDAADARERTPTEQSALPVGVSDELLQPLGSSAPLLVSMATGDASIGDAVKDSALATMAAFGVFAFIVVIAFVAGLATGIVLIVRASRGAFSRLATTLVGESNSIYIELFAAWMMYEVFLSVVPRVDGGVGLIIATQALGLAALAWPVLRGLPWRTVRTELGLTTGGGMLREAVWGLLTWCTAVPMVAVGIGISAVLAVLFGGSLDEATHPLQEGLRASSPGEIVVWYVIAAVVAPVLEEILFRGALYRGLRSASRAWPLVISMIASAFASSLIFASIHPQGLLFIPILGALAVAFCVAREQRGSLIGPMVAHGFNNALIVTLNVFLLT